MKLIVLFYLSIFTFTLTSHLGYSKTNEEAQYTVNIDRMNSIYLHTEAVIAMESNHFRNNDVNEYLLNSVNCNGPIYILNGVWKKVTQPSGVVRATIYDNKIFLKINKNTECQIDNVLNIFSEEHRNPKMYQVKANFNEGLGYFKPAFLSDDYVALNERFEALYGRKLKMQEYISKKLETEIDETAPQLDLILLNTMEFRDDFVGRIFLDALNFHSRFRDTRVYFTASGILTQPNELDVLNKISLNNKNFFSFLYFKNASIPKLSDLLSTIHTVSHIKVFATYSSKNASLNKLIFGGRNLTNNYFYEAKEELNRLTRTAEQNNLTPAFLQNLHFKDLDFVYSFGEQRIKILADLIQLNERQKLSTQFNRLEDAGYVISNPNFDEKSMEADFNNLISQAKKSITIVTPYFNPTQLLKNALTAASARGVFVKIYTNSKFDGDLMASISNKVFAALTSDLDYEIHYYSKDNTLLHAKALLIDDSKLIVGSVNFNRRSFVHDLESAFIILNKDAISDFNNYVNQNIISESTNSLPKAKSNNFFKMLLKTTGDLF